VRIAHRQRINELRITRIGMHWFPVLRDDRQLARITRIATP